MINVACKWPAWPANGPRGPQISRLARKWRDSVLGQMHRIWLSEDALNRAGRMNAKLVEWQKQVAGESTNAPLRVVELLASHPFITAKATADKLGVAFTTAQRAIERLERGGIVKTVSHAKRHRVFCAQPLLDILEEPAQLTPADNLYQGGQIEGHPQRFFKKLFTTPIGLAKPNHGKCGHRRPPPADPDYDLASLHLSQRLDGRRPRESHPGNFGD